MLNMADKFATKSVRKSEYLDANAASHLGPSPQACNGGQSLDGVCTTVGMLGRAEHNGDHLLMLFLSCSKPLAGISVVQPISKVGDHC
jgi:hypothetical protein